MTITFHLNEWWLAGLVLAVICWLVGIPTVRRLYRREEDESQHQRMPAFLWGLVWVVSPVWIPFYALTVAVSMRPVEED